MLPVSVPRGREGYWEIILQLHRSQGHFSVPEIDGETNVQNVAPIRLYVKSLEAAGIVKQVSPHVINHAPARYQLLRLQRRAPAVRKDGTLIPDTAEQRMWIAMRSLKSFSALEMRLAATVDRDHPVTAAAAKAFIERLTDAGYLAMTVAPRGRTPGQWRLKHSMDTGPLPPRRLRIACQAMWDPNVKPIVGKVVTEEPQP